jgi:hypothetical protein
MTPYYRFGQLRLPDKDANAGYNAALLGGDTLGIEVSIMSLADRCGLGNIDPQHGHSRAQPSSMASRSAAEAALTWPLPPAGSRLVTLRLDVDACAAMAVFELRANGADLACALRRRVEMVAGADSFDFGRWCDWAREHPPFGRNYDGPIGGQAHLEYRILARAMAADGFDVLRKVEVIMAWLARGDLRPDAPAQVEAFDCALLNAWRAGKITVETPIPGALAHVCSPMPGASAIGYRYAPVLLLEGEVGGRRKLTVAQFQPGHIDMPALAGRLGALEPGWGGSATIIGSPQGAACGIDAETVVRTMREIGIVGADAPC